MKNKKYQFYLTEKQVNIINKLTKNEFQLASGMYDVVNNDEELITLVSYLNFELGFQKSNEEFMKVEDVRYR